MTNGYPASTLSRDLIPENNDSINGNRGLLVSFRNIGSLTMIGKTVSHYEIVEELGRGGMGMVYKARDLTLGRFVALKFLNRDLLSDEESRTRFQYEAEALASFDHPNIQGIYEIANNEDPPFIALSFYEGRLLLDMTKEGPLPLEQVYDIGMQMAQGLAEAHKKDVIHRDIKPANILLDESGVVKILDFGLAKRPQQTELTLQDTVMGTAAYMSPEQVRGEKVDTLTDIFSFGGLLYEIATGEKPFRGEYSAAVSYSIINENPEPAREINPEIPEAFERVINKALEKDQQDRYQSTAEIAADLQKIRNPDAAQITTKPAGVPFTISKAKAAIAASFLVVALIVSLFFILRPAGTDIASVAVMPFSYEGQDEDWQWLGAAITEMLNTNLGQNSSLRVLGTQQRMRIVNSMGIKDGEITQEQALQIAGKSHSDIVVMGRIEKTGDDIRVEVQLFGRKRKLSVELGPVINKESKLSDVVDDLSSQLIAKLELKDEAKENLTPQVASSLEIFRYFIEGRDAAFDLRHNESIEKLNKAITLDSSFIKAYRLLAFEYAEIGEIEKAKELMTKGKPYVLHLSKEEQLEYLASEAELEKRYKNQAVYLQELLRLKPFDASVHYRYGWIQYQKFRKFDAAITAMQKVIELDSTYSLAYNTLGYAYLRQGEKDAALATIEKYVALNPTDVNPLDSKAEMQALTGQYQEAISTCEYILAIQPDFHMTLLVMARAYLGEGRFTAATRAINDYLVESTYDQASGQTMLAEILLLQGDAERALAVCDNAISFYAENLEAHWIRGLTLLQLNRNNELQNELAILESILQTEGGLDGRWMLHYLNGEIAMRARAYESAIASFTKAIELGPKNRSFYLTALAGAYQKAGKLQDALDKFRAAVAFNPRNAYGMFGLAICYEQAGALSKAREFYDAVLEIWSNADFKPHEHEIAKNKVMALSTKN